MVREQLLCLDRSQNPRPLILVVVLWYGLRTEETCLLKWDAVMMSKRKLSTSRWKGSKNDVHCLQTNRTWALEAPKECYACRYHLFVGEQAALLTIGAIATCRISLLKQSEILTEKLIIKSFNR